LRCKEQRREILYAEDPRQTQAWENAISCYGTGLSVSLEYSRDEWRQIVRPNGIADLVAICVCSAPVVEAHGASPRIVSADALDRGRGQDDRADGNQERQPHRHRLRAGPRHDPRRPDPLATSVAQPCEQRQQVHRKKAPSPSLRNRSEQSLLKRCVGGHKTCDLRVERGGHDQWIGRREVNQN
jgi:hypothetical protein